MSDSGWEGNDRAPRRMRPQVVVGVVVALATGYALASGGFGGDPQGLVIEQTTGPPVEVAYEPVDVVPMLNGTWRRTADAPIPGRAGASATWTGHDVLVWGGIGRRSDVSGALYSVARDQWRRVAKSPLSPRYGHAAVWDGDEVLVAGGRAVTRGGGPRVSAWLRDMAAYNPSSDTWRSLPRLPFPVADGRLFLESGRLYAVNLRADRRPVAVLDAGSVVWRLLPAIDWSSRGDHTAAGVVGGQLLLWPAARGDAVALDLTTHRWTTVERASPQPVQRCACQILTGAMPGGGADVVVYDAAGVQWWRHDLTPMRPSYAGGPPGLSFLVQTAATTNVLSTATGQLLTTPAPPEGLGYQPAATWTGEALFLWGGVSGVRPRFDSDGLIFQPGGVLGHSRIKVL